MELTCCICSLTPWVWGVPSEHLLYSRSVGGVCDGLLISAGSASSLL